MSGAARLPDPQRSRAVLIGAGRYTDPNLPNLPGVGNNLVDLHDLLTAPHGTGLPAAHCVSLADPPNAAVVAEHLTAAAAAAEDLLLVYYAGHGLPWSSSNELYLAMADTKTTIVGSSALRCAEVREVFLASTARTRVLIVDCCFSGRVVNQLMTTEPAQALLGEVDVRGAFVLTATQSNGLAQAPLGMRNTAFTGELVRTLREGIPGGPELLTLDLLYQELRGALRRANLPEPTSNSHNSAAHLALARNSTHRAAHRAEIAHLRGQLEELAALQREYPERLAVLRAAVEDVAGAEARANEVYRSVLDRLADPGIDPTGAIAGDLAGLTPVDQLEYHEMWQRLADQLTIVDRQVAARRRRRAEHDTPGVALPSVAGADPTAALVPDVSDQDGPRTGTILDERYRIVGRLVTSEQDELYLAQDIRVPSVGWLTLRPLLTRIDSTAAATLLLEHRFLTALDHPNLITVHGLVQYTDPAARYTTVYLVEDYLNGRTIGAIADLDERLSLPMVLGYAHEILLALEYLHEKNIAGATLTADTVGQVGEQVTLTGLATLHRIDPTDREPVRDDLRALGRLLHDLTTADQRVTEPFARLLRRATLPDAAWAFHSAEELREQVRGVLVQVLAAEDGRPRPTRSTLFSGERAAFGTDTPSSGSPDWSTLAPALPVPTVDPADPAAAMLAALPDTPADRLAALARLSDRTEAVLAATVRDNLAVGDVDAARAASAQMSILDDTSWRCHWYMGVFAVLDGDPVAAAAAFDRTCDLLPGELAPQLALAACTEWAGDDQRAGALYERIWHTDTTFVSAAFALARVLHRGGRRNAVIAALDAVPGTSTEHAAAQVAAIHARLDPRALAKTDLQDAAGRLAQLHGDTERQARLSIDVLEAKLIWVSHHGTDPDDPEFDELRLRRRLERAYRQLAQIVFDPDERSALVDRANRIRPKTLF